VTLLGELPTAFAAAAAFFTLEVLIAHGLAEHFACPPKDCPVR